MFTKKWFAVLMLVVLALGLAACGGGGGSADSGDAVQGAAPGDTAQTDVTNAESADAEETAAEADVQQTQYPLTVTDASGKQFTFEKAPERIISLAPSLTEVLFALGLDDNVVGVNDWSDYPEEAKSKPKVGGMEANTEAIIEAEPDLIVGGLSLNGATVEQLRGLDLTVFTTEPKSVEETIAQIELVGKITNRNAEAAEVVANMREELKQVQDAAATLSDEEKRSVYLEFAPGWTVGKGEFLDELIALSGAVNVADGTGWYEINEESIIEANPDVILFTRNIEGLGDQIKARAGWDKIEAIAQNRIVGVDDNLVTRTGPRVTQGLLEIAKSIYPEKFK